MPSSDLFLLPETHRCVHARDSRRRRPQRCRRPRSLCKQNKHVSLFFNSFRQHSRTRSYLHVRSSTGRNTEQRGRDDDILPPSFQPKEMSVGCGSRGSWGREGADDKKRKSSPLIKQKTTIATHQLCVVFLQLLYCGQLSWPARPTYSSGRARAEEIAKPRWLAGPSQRLIYSPFGEFRRASSIPYPATLWPPLYPACRSRVYFTCHLISSVPQIPVGTAAAEWPGPNPGVGASIYFLKRIGPQ